MLPMYSFFIHSYNIFEHLLYAKYSAGLDMSHASIAFTFIFLGAEILKRSLPR